MANKWFINIIDIAADEHPYAKIVDSGSFIPVNDSHGNINQSGKRLLMNDNRNVIEKVTITDISGKNGVI